MSKETLDFVPPLPPKNYKISSAFSYNFISALTLDEMMEVFPYIGGEGSPAFLRTYERRWDIVDDVLHYKFDLKVWVSREEDAVLMQSIESYTEEVS